MDHPWAIKIVDALTQPHLVLVDTLTEMSRLLPRAAVGASLGRAEVFKAVPPLFVTYFELILETHPQGNQLQRNEREARTLCMVLDWTLNGETLKLMMVALGRLEVIVTVIELGASGGDRDGDRDGDASGWSVARHHVLTPWAQSAAMLTSRVRENVAREVRDKARTQGQLRAGQALCANPSATRPHPPGRRDQDGANRQGGGRGKGGRRPALRPVRGEARGATAEEDCADPGRGRPGPGRRRIGPDEVRDRRAVSWSIVTGSVHSMNWLEHSALLVAHCKRSGYC